MGGYFNLLVHHGDELIQFDCCYLESVATNKKSKI